KKHDQLARKTMVTTVMSNMGLEQAMTNAGIKVVRTAVGDRYILERMLSDDYNFGGEQSGHIIFLDHNTTGDGLISALQVMALMRRTEKSLSRLAEQIPLCPSTPVNVRVREKKDLAGLAAFQQPLRTHD